MATFTAREAKKQLDQLVEDVVTSHQPIHIAGKRGSAVLLGEEDWLAVQETLYLLSVPGMGQSIRDGLRIPVEECTEDLDG